MDRDHKTTGQAGGAYHQYPALERVDLYERVRFAGFRLIDAIARLVRAGKEH